MNSAVYVHNLKFKIKMLQKLLALAIVVVSVSLKVAKGKVFFVEAVLQRYTEIGKKAWLFAKLQPGRARKRINAT